MDPEHQRRVPPVAESRSRDVSAAIGRAGPRHHHRVAAPKQQRAGLLRDRERDRSLARRAAWILDLRDRRARPDRLALASDRRHGAVAGVEADEGGGRSDLGEHAEDRRAAAARRHEREAERGWLGLADARVDCGEGDV